MYTIELDFDIDEEFLDDMDKFIGVSEPIGLENGYDGTIEDFLRKYVEKGPENCMKIVGMNAEQGLEYGNFEVLEPSSAKLYEGIGTDVPGIAPAYLSDMETINEFFKENRDIDQIRTEYMTESEVEQGSADSKKEAVEDQILELQKQWPEISWLEKNGREYNLWTYRKGEVKILSGEVRGNIKDEDFDAEEAMNYVMTNAPFEDEKEFKKARNNAIISASIKRKPGKEEQMINEIEETGIPASQKEYLK